MGGLWGGGGMGRDVSGRGWVGCEWGGGGG